MTIIWQAFTIIPYMLDGSIIKPYSPWLVMYSDDVRRVVTDINFFFEMEKMQKTPISLDNIMQRLEVATKISRSSLCNILKGKPDFL